MHVGTCVFRCAYLCQCMQVIAVKQKSEDSFKYSVLPIYHVDPRDWTLDIIFSMNYLYSQALLNHHHPTPALWEQATNVFQYYSKMMSFKIWMYFIYILMLELSLLHNRFGSCVNPNRLCRIPCFYTVNDRDSLSTFPSSE